MIQKSLRTVCAFLFTLLLSQRGCVKSAKSVCLFTLDTVNMACAKSTKRMCLFAFKISHRDT